MTHRRYDDAYYQEQLYQLLPALYRARDRSGELKIFLDLFGHEFGRLRANLDQLWDDLYIESCQDWVIPYIGDLLGTEILFNEGARNRIDVQNTIRWRRRKGTLAGLEEIAAEIPNWGAHAVEMFERLVWTQNLNHIRSHAEATVALSEPARLARFSTPFEAECRTVDLRKPDHAVGWHRIRHVRFALWSIPSHPRRGAEPAAQAAGPGPDVVRYRFDPLDRDIALHAGGDRGACDQLSGGGSPPDICAPHADHTPIRARDFADNAELYFGQPLGFSVYEDGILLCRTRTTEPSTSNVPLESYADLHSTNGMLVADESLFGPGPTPFQIDAVRLAGDPDSYSTLQGLALNLQAAGGHGTLDTGTFTYAGGGGFSPDTPDFHHPVMLLRIQRLGAAANFPESELILRNARGQSVLVFLPALAGLPPGQPFHLYVAEDGSTYFGRGAHDAGDPDRNPDSGPLGAYLPVHRARGAEGQVRPQLAVRPVSHRRPVYRNLCCWDQPLSMPLAPDEVAFDPERARFRFPAGQIPSGELSVDFRFAIAGEVGAGPFSRGSLPTPTVTVARSRAADHSSIQDAIDDAPDNAGQVVIEILDSLTYRESLLLNNRSFPNGVVIQAAETEMPVLQPPGGDAFRVTGTTNASQVRLDGLVISGGNVRVEGGVGELSLNYVTLDPASAGLLFDPTALESVFTGSHSILGESVLGINVVTASISDTVLRHPLTEIDAPNGQAVLTSSGEIELSSVTVLGETHARVLLSSNTILVGLLNIAEPEESCIRYSRYRSDLVGLRSFRSTADFPIFLSTRLGHPGFFRLHPNTSRSVSRGGEEGGEMGAFYAAGRPWREQNVRIKLNEFIPAGLVAVPTQVLPASRFLGVPRT